jgi:purine-cytosine permease-like protein
MDSWNTKSAMCFIGHRLQLIIVIKCADWWAVRRNRRRGDAILVGLLEIGSLRVLAQLGYGANPLHRDRFSKIMHEVYKSFDVRRSLEQFKRVGMKPPPGSTIFPQ